MKKLLILVVLPFSVCVYAQTDTTEMQVDSVEVRVIELPDSTAIGAPDGKLVSKEIGLVGGSITSDDGRVELIFPEGALTTATVISIQPIVNLIPNGNGKGYQFEPSGIRFIKPVEIIFHYTTEEEEVCPAQLKFMAIQDKSGKWEYTDYEDWDSTTKSLKGHISHFSALVDGNEVELQPQETTIRVGGKQSFYLSKVEERSQPSDGNDDDELASLPTSDVKSANKQATWSASFGTINRMPGEKIKATYTAPKRLPRSGDPDIVKLKLNTIAIINEAIRIGKKGKMTRKKSIVTDKATFTCRVHLYDEYKVKVYMNFEGATLQYIDNCSFTLKIGNRVEIEEDEPQNMRLEVVQKGKCKAKYVNEATCEGMINVIGIATFNFDPTPSAQGYRRVNITFQPAEACGPILDFTPCPGAKLISPPFVGHYAFPVRISFDLKNEKQLLSLAKGNGAVVKKEDPNDIIAIIEPVRQ